MILFFAQNLIYFWELLHFLIFGKMIDITFQENFDKSKGKMFGNSIAFLSGYKLNDLFELFQIFVEDVDILEFCVYFLHKHVDHDNWEIVFEIVLFRVLANLENHLFNAVLSLLFDIQLLETLNNFGIFQFCESLHEVVESSCWIMCKSFILAIFYKFLQTLFFLLTSIFLLEPLKEQCISFKFIDHLNLLICSLSFKKTEILKRNVIMRILQFAFVDLVDKTINFIWFAIGVEDLKKNKRGSDWF